MGSPSALFKTLHMSKTLLLPEIGNNWLDGCNGQYIVLSLKMSNHGFSMFWRPGHVIEGMPIKGYTGHLLEAGRFDKSVVLENISTFNDGVNSVAIPLTGDALHMLCLGSVTACPDCLGRFKTREIEKPEQ
jgi:hypothetical protein